MHQAVDKVLELEIPDDIFPLLKESSVEERRVGIVSRCFPAWGEECSAHDGSELVLPFSCSLLL